MEYENGLTAAEKVQLAENRAKKIAADAYDNFLIARALGAQGLHEMAATHMATVEALDLAYQAVMNEHRRQTPPEEVTDGHNH